LKILAGPHNWLYFTENFQIGLEEFDTRVFCYENPGELSLHWSDGLPDLLNRLPPDWKPDWVVWWLPEYLRIIPGIEDCPYPTLLVVSDWNVISEPLYQVVEAFDVVATDAMGAERLQAHGVDVPVFQAPLYGFVPGHHRLIGGERDIPVGYIGNTNGLVYNQRMQTLALACHGLEPGQVVIASGVFGEEYVRLLNRFRITINHSLRGELNMRTFEAMACGSLVFCEDSNREAPEHFRDGEHLVLFNQDNLVDKLKYYLSRPEELAEIAENGRLKVQEFTYQRQWARLIQQAEELYQQRERPFKKLSLEEQDRRYANYAYHVFSPLGRADSLDRTRRLVEERGPDDFWVNILACQQAFQADLCGFGEREALLEEAEQNLAPLRGLLPRLSRARILVSLGRTKEAVKLLEEALAEDSLFEEVAYYPRLMHPMAFFWERETDPVSRKRTALWMAHDLLSALDPSNQAGHARAALEYRDDQPTTWIRLSNCPDLSPAEGVDALSAALMHAPFFLEAHLLRLESASPRTPGFVEWARTATHLVRALTGPDFRLTKAELKLRLRKALSPPAPSPPPESLQSFAQEIRFRLCPPEVGLNNLFLWEPTKSIESMNTLFPIDDQEIKDRLKPIADVPRMSTLAVAALINRAVAEMPDQQAYLNVGVWNGYSFLAGLLNNPRKRCIGVDNFSQFGGPVHDFLKRFEQFKGEAHSFHDMDYEEYLRTLHKEPLGLYFYDGEHSYKNQYTGLKAAEKFFAPGCWILVDDTNWEEPRRATLDFIRDSRRRYRMVLDVQTPYSGHPTWWNGLMLFQHLGPIRKRGTKFTR